MTKDLRHVTPQSRSGRDVSAPVRIRTRAVRVVAPCTTARHSNNDAGRGHDAIPAQVSAGLARLSRLPPSGRPADERAFDTYVSAGDGSLGNEGGWRLTRSPSLPAGHLLHNDSPCEALLTGTPCKPPTPLLGQPDTALRVGVCPLAGALHLLLGP